ncbi:MAG: hypothetical protein L3J39_15815, partial [Verrucomicrobiales bacterium]|nr:hypothetical protein [Verrucomicrobiales bacterium]
AFFLHFDRKTKPSPARFAQAAAGIQACSGWRQATWKVERSVQRRKGREEKTSTMSRSVA